jgi:ribonuclease PH
MHRCVVALRANNRFCLQVVLCDGALLPCALNATCAALVDAGIPLHCMFGMRRDSWSGCACS